MQLPVADLEEAYAYAEAHNPLIRAAQERERASRASVEGAKADRRPRLDFQGTAALLPYSAGFSNYSDTLRQTEIKGVVTLSGPLFDSGERAARIHAAEAANDADWRLMDATLRENRATLAGAWNDWQAQTTAIDNLARAVDSAQKAYDGAVLQERAGMFTTLDVLQLARELLQARSAYNEGIAGAYLAKAQVLAALGALDAAWLLPDAPGTTRRRTPGACPARPTSR
ncbi:TolC family protein [Novosphingobium pokkalii]|uniref:TolC family protein n=1 Tax=Novosphingobium pokkalii TaxID=1770194 RepID=UPI003629B6B5